LQHTIIIGGGAAGLFAGAFLGTPNYTILDLGSEVARKLKVSGGGKCNITNEFLDPSYFLGNKAFIEPILERFDNIALLDFLQTEGITPSRVDRVVPGQYFFDSSNRVIKKLKQLQKGQIINNTKVISVSFTDRFELCTNNGNFFAKNIIVASGGMSYSPLGVSDIGYKIAELFGHTLTTPKPALVGFTVQKEQFWFKNLSGVSLDVTIKTDAKTLSGSMLFTHKGCSGPAIMNASLYRQKGSIEIDFLPTKRVEKLLKPSQKQISTLLGLPKRFVKEFLMSIGVEDKQTKNLTDVEIERLKQLNSYRFAPAGTFGFDRAEITSGGVSTEELDSFSLESKLQKGLYFIGEVVDVNGELGGYNLQWCASSAFCVAKYISKK